MQYRLYADLDLQPILHYVIGPTTSWMRGKLSEWEVRQMYGPEQMEHELGRFVWFPR